MREFVQQYNQQADTGARVVVETEIPIDAGQTVIVVIYFAIIDVMATVSGRLAGMALKTAGSCA